MSYKLPTDYTNLRPKQRRGVREQYVKEQDNKCLYCGGDLHSKPPLDIQNTPINLKLFPHGFLMHPIHLQHNHKTGMTEGSVHARCNAILWQYHGR